MERDKEGAAASMPGNTGGGHTLKPYICWDTTVGPAELPQWLSW